MGKKILCLTGIVAGPVLVVFSPLVAQWYYLWLPENATHDTGAPAFVSAGFVWLAMIAAGVMSAIVGAGVLMDPKEPDRG